MHFQIVSLLPPEAEQLIISLLLHTAPFFRSLCACMCMQCACMHVHMHAVLEERNHS